MRVTIDGDDNLIYIYLQEGVGSVGSMSAGAKLLYDGCSNWLGVCITSRSDAAESALPSIEKIDPIPEDVIVTHTPTEIKILFDKRITPQKRELNCMCILDVKYGLLCGVELLPSHPIGGQKFVHRFLCPD